MNFSSRTFYILTIKHFHVHQKVAKKKLSLIISDLTFPLAYIHGRKGIGNVMIDNGEQPKKEKI